MSLEVEALSSSTEKMGLDEEKKEGHEEHNNETKKAHQEEVDETDHEEEEEDDDDVERKIELGPQCTLKEQLERDKEDESLRRWKEQLLGSVDLNSVGETLEPDVKIQSLIIHSPGRSEVVLPIPETGNPKGLWFTLKESSRYSLEFTFKVSNNIVSGLKYTNTVWKTGVKVDNAKEMLGTFSPQEEPYKHEMPEETTPSGMFARGSYSARTKTMIISATWRSTTPLTFEKNGLPLNPRIIIPSEVPMFCSSNTSNPKKKTNARLFPHEQLSSRRISRLSSNCNPPA